MKTNCALFAIVLSILIAATAAAQNKPRLKLQRIEGATIEMRDGKPVEGKRYLLSVIEYDERFATPKDSRRFNRDGSLRERILTKRNAQGDIIETIKYDGAERQVKRMVNSYNEARCVTESTSYDADDKLVSRSVNQCNAGQRFPASSTVYNAKGEVVRQYASDSQDVLGSVTGYAPTGEVTGQRVSVTDKETNRRTSIGRTGDGKITYEQSEDATLPQKSFEIVTYDKQGNALRTIHEMNEQGVTRIVRDASGKTITRDETKYERDANGRVIKTVQYGWIAQTDEMRPLAVSYYTYEYY